MDGDGLLIMESFAQQSYDLHVQQGATFAWVGALVDMDDVSGEITPLDLTSATARMHVRKRPRSTAILIDLTTENGRITLGASNGTVQLNLTHSDTQGLPAGVAFYDLELVTGSVVDRVMSGCFIISQEITRPQ